MTKMRAEINEIENWKIDFKNRQNQNLFLRGKCLILKTLAKLTKKKIHRLRILGMKEGSSALFSLT